MRKVRLYYPLCAIVNVSKFEELGLLLIKEVGEVIDTLFEFGMELRSVVALKVVGDNNSLAVIQGRCPHLNSVGQKVNLLGIF